MPEQVNVYLNIGKSLVKCKAIAAFCACHSARHAVEKHYYPD
jgi:hypothetical protein